VKVAAVIPARLGSHRFAGKVLARDTGKYLVQHVFERVTGCPGIDRVIIATDSDKVKAAAESFGADARLTSPDHVSGTDRVAEVARDLDHDVVINVQGDEPLIAHDDLLTLLSLFQGEAGRDVVMTTLAVRRTDEKGFHDPNVVKVVLGRDRRALYFSRSPVPYDRDGSSSTDADESSGGGRSWYQHVGIYAYRRDFLLRLSSLPPSELERRERLEQLRVLENGHVIRVGLSEHRHLGIDTPEEYRSFVEQVAQKQD